MVRRLARIDDLTIIGLITLVAWILLADLWILRGRPSQLLWLSDIAMILTAVGFLFRSRLVITAQFVGIFAYHIAWQFDLAAYAVIGRTPLDAASYMVGVGLSPLEKALSLFQHIYLIPATAWGIIRLGAARKGWVLQTLQTGAVIAVTYIVTNPAHNVNWISGVPFASPARTGAWAYYALVAVGPPLLLYLPTNALANWLSRSELAGRIRRSERRSTFAAAIGGSVILATFSLAVASSLRPTAGLPTDLRRLSLQRLEALPVDAARLQLSTIEFGPAGMERSLRLMDVEGPLPAARGLGRAAGLIYMKRLLDRLPIDEIPGAPQHVVARGIRGRDLLAIMAVVASDRLYPQAAVDSAEASGRFELRVQLGRDDVEEFGLDSDRPGAPDPFIVGNGVGAIYAITIVGIERDGPAVRTPFFLFKRTGLHAPGDLDSLGLRPGEEPRNRSRGAARSLSTTGTTLEEEPPAGPGGDYSSQKRR